MLELKTFKGGYDFNFSYLVWDDVSLAGCVIDTALNPAEIFAFADENNIKIRSAVVMHSHFDHTVMLESYREKGVELIGHINIKTQVDRKVDEKDYISVGSYKLEVMHCPGHTQDAICLLNDGKLFTTDVLFIDGCGRCDLKGGDASLMWKSLQKIMALPDNIIIYPGHDYGAKPFDTLVNQKRTNHFLTALTKEEFVNERMSK
jgi:hydroxyacylglutathione hydrolase